MGAWIEMALRCILINHSQVAPHMGAWIEIGFKGASEGLISSHPIWVRGLK